MMMRRRRDDGRLSCLSLAHRTRRPDLALSSGRTRHARAAARAAADADAR